ncbi:MAG: alpha/beta hydrolase [Actinomycetota bacterium]|nr:alpha/beta hydrolase [Actinomycetota bacterium]
MRAGPPKSTKFLLLAGLGALGAANGFRPFHRRGKWSAMPVWSSGLAASEAPLACAATQVGVAALAVRRLGLKSPAALATVAVAGASASGYAQLYRRAGQTAPVLQAALADALGNDFAAQRHRCATPTRSDRAGALLSQRARYTVPGAIGIAYGVEGGKKNTLDVWRRPDLPLDGRAPVLVQIHGGAWATGDNLTQAIPLVARMVEAGWVCVLPRYRLSPKATWPAHIVDIMAVIAWTKANIAGFGGDPGFVALTGGSAGAHLSALAALAHDHQPFKPGIEHVDTRVQAVAPLYGAYDWLDRDHNANPHTVEFVCGQVVKQSAAEAEAVLRDGSPRTWVRADAPPFFVIHGQNDALLPVEQARSFVGALRAQSHAPVAYAELPLGQHGFDFARTPRTLATVDAVQTFLEVVHGRHRASVAADAAVDAAAAGPATHATEEVG